MIVSLIYCQWSVYCREGTVWFGLYREGGAPPDCPNPCREGFQWVDGSAVDYTNWTPHEPSRVDDYAVFMRYTGVWFADPLQVSRAFICERGSYDFFVHIYGM